MSHTVLLLAISGLWLVSAARMEAAQTAPTAPQWQEVELTFTASRDTANPYTDIEAWADFTHEDGTKIRRPMFWDGGRTFRVRFASTKSSGTWRWTTSDRDGDPGLARAFGNCSPPAPRRRSPRRSSHGMDSGAFRPAAGI